MGLLAGALSFAGALMVGSGLVLFVVAAARADPAWWKAFLRWVDSTGPRPWVVSDSPHVSAGRAILLGLACLLMSVLLPACAALAP